jgi:HD-like signal output (HDOD) protein
MVTGAGTATTPTRLSPLEAAVARVRAADDFPAVSGKIQQLMEVLNDEDTHVQRLANLIIQDYSLTLKLLRNAHSFRFNRSGVAVVSATHAIVMMGARAVRDLVSGITIFEHFQRKSPALRPLLMLSLLSANHARELASPSLRGEEAYLLGMLRNLGEVLVACYMPTEYAAVLKDMADHQSSASAACRRILHFDYEELARAVVTEWQMPEKVTRVLSESAKDDSIAKVVNFAHKLTTVVYREGTGTSSQAVNLLLQKYSELGLTKDDVAGVLKGGIEGTRETFKQAGVHLNALQLQHQMTAALIENPDAVSSPIAAVDAPGDEPVAAAEVVSRAVTEVRRAAEDDAVDLNKVILMILEATMSAGSLDRAVLALVSATRSDVTARLGLGHANEEFLARFRFPLGPAGGPIGMAVSRRQELTIAKSWQLMRDEQRLLATMGAGALVLIPIGINGRTVGALYADTKRSNPPTESAIAVVREMRDAIVAAMMRRGRGAQPGAASAGRRAS